MTESFMGRIGIIRLHFHSFALRLNSAVSEEEKAFVDFI